MRGFLLVLLVFATAECAQRAPIWKVFCSGTPLYRGRIDPIVNPGAISGHSHKVAGGNHFSAGKVDSTPISIFDELFTSTCTTCSISEVDLSAYWHPDLYYKWPNGTFSLVPDGGLTVYYLSRAGSGDQANPDWKPIPKGLRMLAGSPYRRSFSGSVADQAINYACLTASGVPGPAQEPNNFPTDNYFCQNGLRAQVFFPMCWDGKNLDSPDHKSHMAYPSSYNGGNCPSTHPVRIPGVFFEAFYAVSDFPHGTGTNPFVWSCGDPTGYGFHGDFLSGWDEATMAAALNDSHCDNNNPDMAFGNNVKACPPLAPYVQDTPAGKCTLESPIPLTEDLAISSPIAALPGCNPLTYGPEDATPCSSPPTATTGVNRRFLLKSVSSGKYLSAPFNTTIAPSFVANSSFLTLNEIFDPIDAGNGLVSIRNENTLQYLSVNGPDNRVMGNRGTASDWELFTIETHSPNVAIKANRNSQYLTYLSDGTFAASAAAVNGDTELFVLEAPGGGSIGSATFQTNAPLTRYSGFSGDTRFTESYSEDPYGYGDTKTNNPNVPAEGSAARLVCSFLIFLIVALLY